MNFSNFKSKYRKGIPARLPLDCVQTRPLGLHTQVCSYKIALRLLFALLIRDLLNNDRQVAGHAVDRDRDALRGRVE